MATKHAMSETRRRRRDAGLCYGCGGPPVPGGKSCEGCRIKESLRRAEKIAAGMCSSCRTLPADVPEYKTCTECRNKQARRLRDLRRYGMNRMPVVPPYPTSAEIRFHRMRKP